MANTVTGRIVSVGQTVNVSREKEFLKRELVLDCSRFDEYTGEKRENFITLSFTQKRCEELNGFVPGELVDVSFILNGRKYDKDGHTRYITDVVGYKVERRAGQGSKAAPQAIQAPQAPQAAPQPPASPFPPQQPYLQPVQTQQAYQQPPYQGQPQYPPQDTNLPF